MKVSIKELDDVLMRDVGGKIAESGRYSIVNEALVKREAGYQQIIVLSSALHKNSTYILCMF